MAQPEATDNKNISKNNIKNIWRINKNNLPLHPQSREMRQRHGGRDAWRGEAEVGKSKRKRRTPESGRKNFRKNLEDEGKVLTFAPATRQSAKGSSLKDLHIQRVVQVLKKTYRQKKYLSSNKKGILG